MTVNDIWPIAAVCAYFMIGAFVSGLAGEGAWAPDFLVVLFWPALCVVAALMFILRIPYRIGYWIYEKFFW